MALSRAACVWRTCSGLVSGHRLLLPAAVRTQSSVSGHRLLLPAAVRTQSSVSGHRLLLPAAVRTQSSVSGHRLLLPAAARTQSSGSGLLLPAAVRTQSSVSGQLLPRTSLSSPPWPELLVPLEEEESRLEEQHAAVVSTVNRRILQRDFGRLFAVVHFSGRQWKVTAEDLVLLENRLEAQCGERIRMEKVLLVGAEDFTLLGRPLLDRDLVRVEATVIERTESWPKVHMRFWKRHRFQRKRIIIQPQTVLRINSIQLNPALT